MKVLNLVLLMFLLAGTGAAQDLTSLPDAPGVAVIEKRWRRSERRNPKLDEDPLRVAHEQAELERARREVIQQNVIRAKAEQQTLPLPTGAATTRTEGPRHPAQGVPGGYTYEVKISNTGSKKIRKLVWEYVLFDTDTRREVGHHRFTSKVSISPGKRKNLVGNSISPPASVVDITKAGKESRDQYSERIVIHRIEYDDGSVWERPSN